MSTQIDIWTYRGQSGADRLGSTDISGFEVEALDGSIGKIDEATYEVGASEIVIDTGPWIFGKKVILPAGVVDRIDVDEETVYVNRSKDQIKNAPELDEHAAVDDAYRDQLSSYYGPRGTGWQDWPE